LERLDQWYVFGDYDTLKSDKRQELCMTLWLVLVV